jgi:hypothetical protein
LEKASLEDPGSELIDKWANLLASAVESPGDDLAMCTSILAELGPTEAGILDQARVRLQETDHWPKSNGAAITESWTKFVKGEYGALADVMADFLEEKITLESTIPLLQSVANRSPNVITWFNFTPTNGVSKNLGLQFTEPSSCSWMGPIGITVEIACL